MFKRVGATIVTIVMLLSMASVFSSALSDPMGLTVELVDGLGNPLSSAAPGDAVNAVVKIKNPVAISGMAIVGEYDENLFAQDGTPEIESHTVGGVELKGITEERADKKIVGAWVADSNVELPADATLMIIPLIVKDDAALGSAAITFAFVKDEMYVEAGGAATPLETTKFDADPVEAPIVIAPATQTSLEVVAPADAEVGETIDVVVNVKDYADNWQTMSIIGTYDPAVLKPVEGSAVPGAFKNSAMIDDPIVEIKDGKIAVVWVNEDVVDNEANFEALKLSFEVLAAGDANLSFSFKEDGIFGAGNAPAATGSFVTTAVEKEINITVPVPDVLLEVVAPAQAKVGETITVKVNVKNYADAWSAMTIKGTYDAEKFELLDINPSEFTDGGLITEPIVEKDTGVLAATWINTGAVVKGAEFEALELTFKVLKDTDGKGTFDFAFVPDGLVDGNGDAVDADTYVEAAPTTEVVLLPSDVKTSLEVSVDSATAKYGDKVTYSVNVRDYYDNWQTMTVLAKYDSSKLKFIGATNKTTGFTSFEAVQSAVDPDTIGIAWANADAAVLGKYFEAVDLVFEVIAEVDVATDTAVAFKFKPDGIILGQDADGNDILAPETTYVKDEVSKEVELIPIVLPTGLEVSVDVATAKVGEQVTYTVNVKNYADAWQAMTILAKYDSSKLKFIGANNKTTGFTSFEAVQSAVDPDTIGITWANADAVVLGKNFTAVDLVFEVIAEGDTEVAFKFKPDGIIIGKDTVGDDIFAPADTYLPDEVAKEVTLLPSDIPTTLDVTVDPSSAHVGEKVTYTVNVKDYADKWQTMTILAKYDSSKLRYVGTTSSISGFSSFEAVESTAEADTIGVVWANADPVTLGKNFKAMEMVFEVIADGEADVSFKFKPDGLIVEKDPATGDETYAPDGSFSKDEVSETVTLLPALNQTNLEVVAGADSAELGETVTYSVNVKKYADDWRTMSIVVTYDPAKLQYVGATSGTDKFTAFEVVESAINPGTLTVVWANAQAVVLGEEFKALDLVFKALAETGEGAVSAEFKADGLIAGKDPVTGEDVFAAPGSFSTEKATDSVTLLPVSATPYLEIVGVDNVNEREEYTVDLVLKDYGDKWSAFAAYLEYDEDKFEYIGSETKPFGDASSFIEKVGNQIRVVVMPSGFGNIDAAEENVLMTVKFKAKKDGNAEFKASIPEANTFDAATQQSKPAASGSYVEDAQPKTVVIANTSYAYPELDTNNVGTIGQFEEVTVNMTLKGYEKNWSSFGAELLYDATVFAVEDASKVVVNAFGGVTPAIDTSVAGKIRLDWSAAANIDAAEGVLVSVTFKANGYGDNVAFNANLVDVKTFDGSAHVDVDADDYAATATAVSVNVQKLKKPYLTIVTESGNTMDEGTNGVLKIYLNDYTSKWCSVPVVLEFDPQLIQIKEDEMVCYPMGTTNGEVLLRKAEGKLVFTWLSANNIQAADNVLLAEIPFRAYKDGVATFGAEFIADSVETHNPAGGSVAVAPDTYIPEADDQNITIVDKYENMDPMELAIGAATEVTKNKKDNLTLTLSNFNSRVQALSVKLFYDKNSVTITEEDVEAMQIGGVNGEAIVNADEGYVHFAWATAEMMVENATTITLGNIAYTATAVGQTSFYAVIDQLIEYDEVVKEPIWDYVERSATVTVDVKAIPYLSVKADKTDVKIGDTITVTVSVNEYMDLWSTMTINGSFDKNLLKLESITQTDAFNSAYKHLVYVDGEDSLKATWFDTANIAADGKFDALILVFKALDGGTAKFNFAFETNDGILTDGTTPLVPNEDFVVDAQDPDEIVIAICDHKWSDKPVHKDGTSGTASKHLYTCTKGCGATKEEACTVKTTAGDPTCDKPGTITYKCAKCGYNETVDNPEVPALGHKFDGKPVHKDGTKKHVYTCTRNGCTATKEENCSYKTQVVQRTCLKDGYTIYTCTACGDSYTGNVVKAPGKHGALVLHYIAPTASTNGSIITQCDSCKEYVVPPYAGAVKKTLKAGHPFPDVQDPKSWYYDAVNFSKAFEIFGGDEKGNFNPTANITRGQLVTVLGRIIMPEAEKTMSAAEFNAYLNAQTSRVEGMKSASGFTDLGGKYYERYAKLFAKWGIVNGYPDGTFGGDKNITREEMATLIKRFVEAYPGAADDIKFGNAATFSDFAKVSGWAKGNVEWVGKVGLFQGDANKNYNPKSNATRAEIAVVIYRMLPVLKNICVCSINH